MKRSSRVALLLMGVTGVGATGYAMTRPPPNCVPHGSPAATVAPATPGIGANEPCPQRRSWSSSGGSGYGYRSSWTRTNSSANSPVWPRPVFTRTATSATASGSVPLTNRSSTTSPSHSSTTTTTRGGFGSTASSHSSSSGS
jgi:hypothetical protein